MPKILANEINIYYEIHGDDNNPPVVLVGGLSRDHNIWNPVLPYLTSDYKVILIDNRGAGQTDKPEGPYDTEMLGKDLAALLAQLKLGPAHIIGHSMGGFASMFLAAYHPELVADLILCSTCSKQPKEGITYLTQRLELLRVGTTPPEEMIRTALPWLHTKKFLSEENIQSLINAAFSNPHPQPKAALEAQTIACINHDATKILSSIKAPTLVITGRNDKVMTPQVCLDLKNQIQGADLVLIDNSAHMLQTETPEMLCSVIKSFIQKPVNKNINSLRFGK
jgi:3-oxoadipate enol-lactonase